MFNIYEGNYRPSLMRRILRKVEDTVSTVVESVVEFSEDIARDVATSRLLESAHHVEDEADIVLITDLIPSKPNKYHFDPDLMEDYHLYNTEESKLGRLADSIEVLITEYRIRIRKIRRTGVNQYKILEQSMLHNCQYLQQTLSESTNAFVQEYQDEITDAKIRLIITTEEKVEECKTNISTWFDDIKNSVNESIDNIKIDAKINFDEFRDSIYNRYNETIDIGEQIVDYAETELVVDGHQAVEGTHLAIDNINKRIDHDFNLDMGIFRPNHNPRIRKYEVGRFRRYWPSSSSSDDESSDSSSSRTKEKEIIGENSNSDSESSSESSSDEDFPRFRLQEEVIGINNLDDREDFEEDPENDFIDKFLAQPFDFAPKLENGPLVIDPYVKEKFQKAIFEYKHNPTILNAYYIAASLSDVGFEPVFVQINPVAVKTLQLNAANMYDLRSDQHNSGKLTRQCTEFYEYRVTTTELSRGWKPFLFLNVAREALRVLSSNNPNERIKLKNILEERQHIHGLTVSPDLLYQITSPKTMNIHTTSEKSQLNLDLATRTNSSVNLPYNLAYGASAIRENTASFAHAMRDSLKWSNYGNGTNFHL